MFVWCQFKTAKNCFIWDIATDNNSEDQSMLVGRKIQFLLKNSYILLWGKQATLFHI